MSNLKSWVSSESTGMLSRSRLTTTYGALLAANTRAQAELGHLFEPEQQQDPRGQTLRLLRLQSNRDPVFLATEACISLRQFYQLENGETSLFYNTGLRNQAGRRVATLLGVRWDELDQTTLTEVQEKYIKLVSSSSPEGAPSATGRPVVPLTVVPQELAAVPVGRDKPATDTVVLPPPVMAQDSHKPETDAPSPRSGGHPLWTLSGWLLATLAGAATGSALVEFAGVRMSMLLRWL